MDFERPVLNRSMMERYDIPAHRPASLRAVLFGMDDLMLGGVARCLDRSGVGALCVTQNADALTAQDCMFTMLLRGGTMTDVTEYVVQSLLCAVNPDTGFDEMLTYADRDGLDGLFCHAEPDAVEYALVTRFLCQMAMNRKKLPTVYLVSDFPSQNCAERARRIFKTIAAEWNVSDIWDNLGIAVVLCDGLFGKLTSTEATARQDKMNYTDNFLMWAHPDIALFASKDGDLGLSYAENIAREIEYTVKTARALEFLCAPAGYLMGKDTFSEVMADEYLRKWIAHAWFDEFSPNLTSNPELRERTIRTFERYEDSYNSVPLLSARNLLSRAAETVLPRIRSYSRENFEAPRLLTLAFSAAVMLYAGVTRTEKGYEVSHGKTSDLIKDEAAVLQSFEALSHDMPAETLTYAVLADRSLWDEDLREIDGLEMAVVSDISSIQRIGFLATMQNRIADL